MALASLFQAKRLGGPVTILTVAMVLVGIHDRLQVCSVYATPLSSEQGLGRGAVLTVIARAAVAPCLESADRIVKNSCNRA